MAWCEKKQSTNTNGNVATHLIDRSWSSKGVFVILLEAEIAKATKLYHTIHGLLLSQRGSFCTLSPYSFLWSPFGVSSKVSMVTDKPPLTWYPSTRLQTKIT